MELITTNNLKTNKGNKYGYSTAILHLAPFTLSGKNVCPKASNGCASACLNTSGHGRFDSVQNARKKRTLLYFNERAEFEAKLTKDINAVIRRAEKNNLIPAIRINGTSDLPALAIRFANKFPNVQHYDYTKVLKTLEKPLPKNYHLTFSRSENNESECIRALELGFNVAVVFEKMPKTYLGHKVVTGEDSDLRFLDIDKRKKPVIIGLTAKGKAKKDTSGFVVRVEEGGR